MKRSTLALTGALVLSVSINLGIAGVWAGHWLRDEPQGSSDRLLSGVPEEIHRQIRTEMRARTPEIRQRMEAMRNAKREASESLRARPFDVTAAEQAFATLRAETLQGQEHFHHSLIEKMGQAQAAGNLPPPPPLPERHDRGGQGDGRPDQRPPEPPRGEAPPPPPPPAP